MKKILCIGSVTTDVIVTPADTIPTPGTLRYVDSVSTHVGGCASNAAIDLAKLGVPVALACKVGEDNFGTFVRSEAAAAGVDVSGVVSDPSVSTTVSIVCISSTGERSFLYNPGSTSAFTKADIPEALVDECDIIFVAGAMLLTSFDGKPCAEFMKECQEKGKYTVMDTAWDSEDVWMPKVQEVLPYLDLFMPSIEEAARLTGEEDPNRIADRFFAMGVKNVIVKWGKHGALVCPAGGERMVLPTIQPAPATRSAPASSPDWRRAGTTAAAANLPMRSARTASSRSALPPGSNPLRKPWRLWRHIRPAEPLCG